MRSILVTAVFSLAACLLGPALADEAGADKAKESFQKGVRHYEAQEFEAAILAFREAYRLKPSWKLLYNVGQCEVSRKHYGQAIEAFERYLAEAGDAVSGERLSEVLSELERLRKMVGGIKVKAAPGTTVQIDGEVRGTTPMARAIQVTAGLEHVISFVREGKEIHRATEVVSGGETIEIESSPPPPGALPNRPESEAASRLSFAGPSEAKSDGKSLRPLWFWIGAGSTVVFGAATLVANFAVQGKKDSLTDAAAIDAARNAQKAGIAFLVLTGAAAVTTGVLAIFTDFSAERETAKAALRPGFGVSQEELVLTIQGRF